MRKLPSLPQPIVRLLILALLVVPLIAACSGSAEPATEADYAAVYDLVELNLYYNAVEDLNGVAWTLHEDSRGRQQTLDATADMFERFDLSFAIVDWEILEIDSQEARIRVVQETRKISGEEPFRDNRLEAVHTLKKNSNGEWKLFSSEYDQGDAVYLD